MSDGQLFPDKKCFTKNNFSGLMGTHFQLLLNSSQDISPQIIMDLSSFQPDFTSTISSKTIGNKDGYKVYYRSGTVYSNMVNSKFHLIQSFFEIFTKFLSFHV